MYCQLVSRHRQGFSDLDEQLHSLRKHRLFRTRRVIQSPQGREVLVDGKTLLNFSSNDYLGLASDTRIASALQEGARRWGTGSGASHLISGHTVAHHRLEEELADFVGRPSALLFGSGYAANVGTINALLSEGDCVYEDRLNHASLLDGGWISRANFHWYNHCDAQHLRALLDWDSSSKNRRLVVSDGVFSMDGDSCPLTDLISLTKATGSWLMIDDAHGMGVVGKDGVGTVDSQEVSTSQVPVLVGTLGKAFGTSGAFVAGEENLIELLIQRSRNYIFTTAMPAALAFATSVSLAIVREEGWRRAHISALVQRFHSGLQELQLPWFNSMSAIQPVILKDTVKTLAVAKHLEDQGCFVVPIRPPTVPEGTSRLRVTITAAHRMADVDRLIDSLQGAIRN